MMRNRPPRPQRRPGVEACEPRCLLSAVDPSLGLEPTLTESPPTLASSSTVTTSQDVIIGASEARARFGVTGAGLTAAVIDTGVDYDHPAFGEGGFGDGGVVRAGHDFAQGDADPMTSNSSHGTAVAGIIASRDPGAPGVAPGAEIAALRVFGDDGRGSFEAIADALQWVVNNHERHNISVVNLSISDGKNYLKAPSLFAGPVVTRVINLIDTLEDLKIPVVTAAGNSFSGQQGMGFTAIVDDTISVTGSDGPSAIAPDAQRLGRASGGPSATDLLAPGRDVMGPWEGDAFAPLDGTSFAAPLVTGSVLLLQELHLKRFGTLPTVDQLEGWLRDSASPVRDAVTGITIGRLDIPAAAEQVPTPSIPLPPVDPVVPSPLPATPAPGGPVDPPSTPVAEPPVGQGGSDDGTSSPASGSGNDSDSGSAPTHGDSNPSPAPAPSEPTAPSTGSDAPDSGSPESVPDAPQTGRPPIEPGGSPGSDPGSTPLPPPSDSATPGSSGPIASPPSSVEPPNSPEPSPTTDRPDGSGPIDTPVDGDLIDSAIDAVVTPVVPDPVPGEAPGDEVEIPSREPIPFVDPNASTDAPRPANDAPARLAALFNQAGPAFGVRAWGLGRTGSPALWSRAQFVRSARAEAASKLRVSRHESIRPFPTSSARMLAALSARRSMR